MGGNTFPQHRRMYYNSIQSGFEMYSGDCANKKQSAIICKSIIENSPKTIYLKLHRFLVHFSNKLGYYMVAAVGHQGNNKPHVKFSFCLTVLSTLMGHRLTHQRMVMTVSIHFSKIFLATIT